MNRYEVSKRLIDLNTKLNKQEIRDSCIGGVLFAIFIIALLFMFFIQEVSI